MGKQSAAGIEKLNKKIKTTNKRKEGKSNPSKKIWV